MTRCPECGGSGVRWGFNREIECPSCGGEGMWDDEPELCRCGQELVEGECAVCDWRIIRDRDPETGNERVAA